MSYLASKGEDERNVCLIPLSAHGTNPASAQMAGMKVVPINVAADGSIDLADLNKKVSKCPQLRPSTVMLLCDACCALKEDTGYQLILL